MSDFWKLFFVAFGLGAFMAAVLAAVIVIILL